MGGGVDHPFDVLLVVPQQLDFTIFQKNFTKSQVCHILKMFCEKTNNEYRAQAVHAGFENDVTGDASSEELVQHPPNLQQHPRRPQISKTTKIIVDYLKLLESSWGNQWKI